MVKDAFDRFINFGSIGDKKSREQIANAIYSQLQKKSEKGIGFTNVDSDNFATAIEEILSNLTMKELCSKDPELAEKITYEILDFINKTNRIIGKSENPIGDEYLVFKEFEQSKKSEFKNKWVKVS